MKRLVLAALVLLALALAVVAIVRYRSGDRAADRGRTPGGRGAVAYPVETEAVALQSLTFAIGAVGSVEAFEQVQVTARVAGTVDRIRFAEGDYAEAGTALVEIETERYQLAVQTATAARTRAAATLADVEAGLQRREAAIAAGPGLIPREEVETWRTKAQVARADVSAAQAALDQAALNLRDAYVRAPFAGIIQTRTVQTGQYVQAGDVLATLVRRQPLLLRFAVPDRDAGHLQPGQAARFTVAGDTREYGALITHVAGQADGESRMVAVAARIDDTGAAALRPGTFAEVTVPVSGAREVPVVPLTAIRPSERGFLAYAVVGGKAAERLVVPGLQTADGRVEIVSGLAPGEQLVVRGGEALRDGVAVRTGDAAAPAPR